MQFRIVVAVGNMIDVLGLARGTRGFSTGAVVDNMGMSVERSHFSPTEAMEETWTTT